MDTGPIAPWPATQGRWKQICGFTSELRRISQISARLIVFSYHKSGTSLLRHVMTKVCARLGLTLVNHYGLIDRLEPESDVILLPHSLLSGAALTQLQQLPYRAIRMIRDPRDIWVSAYLYHLHCIEPWCINTDHDPAPPISWPKVDHSFAHWPEPWKRQYLQRLDGRSYQQRLLGLELAEGLEFELSGYTGCTLAAMQQWPSYGLTPLDVKLEDAMADFDGTMLRIFDHFGFTMQQTLAALDVARSEDIRRMDDATLAKRPQIHSRVISRWRDFLPMAQREEFERCYGDLIAELGYALADPDPGTLSSMDPNERFDQPEAPFAEDLTLAVEIPPDGDVEPPALVWPQAEQSGTPEQDADIWLSADGVTLRPMQSAAGSRSFIVPAQVQQVRLESRRHVPTDLSAPYLGFGRALGVRVSGITIRSRSNETVIPADDPRLVEGWHAVEHTGAGLWRWTDGSAELPWASVSGPAVVTIRCQMLAQHPTDARFSLPAAAS